MLSFYPEFWSFHVVCGARHKNMSRCITHMQEASYPSFNLPFSAVLVGYARDAFVRQLFHATIVVGVGGTWIRTRCTSDELSGSSATYLPASAPCPTRQPEEARRSLGLSTLCPSVCWYSPCSWTCGLAIRRYCTDNRDFKKPLRRRQGLLKSGFIFYLRISRYS